MTTVWERTLSGARHNLGAFRNGLICMIALPVLLFTAFTCLITVGLWVFPPELRLLGRLTDAERARAGRRLGRDLGRHGPRGRTVRELAAEPGTWRDLRWVPVTMLLGSSLGLVGAALLLMPLVALVSIGLWWVFPENEPMRVLANIPVTSWTTAALVGIPQFVLITGLAVFAIPRIANLLARISASMLAPSEREQLSERVEVLEETRAGAVDAHGNELRRIERDLHDGTQARLVSIAMRLGLAERQLGSDPQAVAKLLAEAREGAEEAMVELRGVLRSMYPPILADRGLEGALGAVAANCGLPVELDVPTLGQLPAPVEAAAYYVVNEALTNVVKHSGATGAQVTVTRIGEVLSVLVMDNGRGGIDEARGTGVAGMRRRIAALDGQFMIDSPAGGPTVLAMECPCGS